MLKGVDGMCSIHDSSLQQHIDGEDLRKKIVNKEKKPTNNKFKVIVINDN